MLAAVNQMFEECIKEGRAIQRTALNKGQDIKARIWTWEEVLWRLVVKEAWEGKETDLGCTGWNRERARKRRRDNSDEDFDQDGIRIKRMRDDGESQNDGWSSVREALENECEQTSRQRCASGDNDGETGEVRGMKRKKDGGEGDRGGPPSFEIVLR